MAAASKAVQSSLPFSAEHGSQIFVYTHLRTRQTVYSLTKAKSKVLLNQLTFVGKKSVPPTLRRDMWAPLCVISFPNRFQGLHAYARLREFRERHETEWPLDEFTVKKGPQAGKLLPRKERTFKLMDQKANSIADMAAVLTMQARPPDPALVERMAKMVHTKTWEFPSRSKDGENIMVEKVMPHWGRAKRGQNSKIGHRVFEFEGNIDGTSVWWADPNDAEYAESWPREVVHAKLGVSCGQFSWPPPAEVLTKPAEPKPSIMKPMSILEKVSVNLPWAGKAKQDQNIQVVEEFKQPSQEPLTIEEKIEAARRRARDNVASSNQRVMADSITDSVSIPARQPTI